MKKKYGKQKNLRACMALLALCSLGLGGVTPVEALLDNTNVATEYAKVTTTYRGQVAIGLEATTDNNFATALGSYSNATGVNSISIGYTSKANGEGSIAIGKDASSTQRYTVAIGSEATAECEFNVAVGYKAVTGSYTASVALGNSATIGGNNSTAIGANSSASGVGSVALGYQSVASEENTVSVGSGNTANSTIATRRIVNVAAGTSDNDAVNYKQLTDAIAGISGGGSGGDCVVDTGTDTKQSSTNHWLSTDFDETVSTHGVNSAAYGYTASATGTGATAIGYSASASGAGTISIGNSTAYSMYSIAIGEEANTGDGYFNAIAIGHSADASGDETIAIGRNAKATGKNYAIVVGTGAKVTAISGTAVGSNAQATGESAVALGGSNAEASAAKAGGKYATALGYSSNAYGESSIAIGDAWAENTKNIAIGTGAHSSWDESIAIGSGATVGGTESIGIGKSANTNNMSASVALGGSSKTSGIGAVALGHSSSASGANAVALGYQSVASADNTVSVGSGNAENGTVATRKIVNVTAGTANNDAATYGQLVNAKADNSASPVTYTAYTPDDDGIVTVETNNGGTAFKLDLSSIGDCVIDTGTDDTQSSTNHWLSTDFSSSSVTHGFNSAAYGYLANASGDYATATGYRATAKGQSSIALGSGYYSDMTMTLRSGATAYGANSIALGITSQTGYTTMDQTVFGGTSAVAIGDTAQAYGDKSIALGYKSETGYIDEGSGTTYGNSSVSIGDFAKTYGNSSVALGKNAYTKYDNSVAVGAESVVTAANTVSFGHKKNDFAGYYEEASTGNTTRTETNGFDAVYYTSDSFARLMNVADGTDNHDAATYGQLVNAKADNSASPVTYTAYTPDDDGIVTVETNNGGTAFKLNLSSLSTSYTFQSGNTNALTVATSDDGTNTVTITPQTDGIKSSSEKLVTGKTVYDVVYAGKLNLGLNNTNTSGNSNTTVVGYWNTVQTSSGKSNAFGYMNESTGDSSTALGVTNHATGDRSVSVGYDTAASGYQSAAVGVRAMASGKQSAAFGFRAYAGADNATAIGKDAVASTAGTISFGHKENDFSGYYTNEYGFYSPTKLNGYEAYNYTSDSFTRLVNVADGIDDHDVATVGQLNEKVSEGSLAKVTADSSVNKVNLSTQQRSAATPATAALLLGEEVETNNSTNTLGQNNQIVSNDGTVLAEFTRMTSAELGDTGFVAGEDLYNETRLNVSGTYVSKDDDAGTNLAALDTKIGTIDDTKTTTAKQANTISKNLELLDAAVKEAADSQYEVGSGDNNTLTVDTDSLLKTVTITAQTGDITESSKKLVTGEKVYNVVYANALMLGSGNTASGTDSTAVGQSNTASGEGTSAVGYDNTAGDSYAAAFGTMNIASGEYSSAFGASSMASGDHSSAVGYFNVAQGDSALAVGSENVASGTAASVFGAKSIAMGDNAVAVGYNAYAGAAGATAVGVEAVSTEAGTVSFGHKEGDLTGYYQDSQGNLSPTKVDDTYTAVTYTSDSFARLTNVAEGTDDNDAVNVKQLNDALHGTTLDLGYSNTVDNTYNTALGFMNTAEGWLSTAVGSINTASKDAASAFGYGNEATGSSSVAVGFYNTASGLGSDALGVYNEATGERSTAVGVYSSATADYSSAMGYGSVATGEKSTAMGYDAYAGAEGATAIGYEASAKESGTVSFGHKDGDFAGYYVDDDGNSSNVAKDGYTAVNYDGDSFARLINVADGEDNHDAATFGQIAAEDQSITLKDGENVIKANDGTTEIAEFTGMQKVSANDYGFVSGADLYAEGRENASGTIISAKNDVGTNLSLLDEQVTDLKDLSNITTAGKSVVKTLSQEAVVVESGKNIKVTQTSDKDGNITYTVSTDLGNSGEMSKKADTDAGNVGKNLQGTDGASGPSVKEIEANLDAWGAAIGTGKVAEDSGQLVTGATVYKETRANVNGTYVSKDKDVGTNLSALDKYVAANVKDVAGLKNLSNLTQAGENVIKNRAQEAVVVAAGDNVTVDPTTDKDGNITYTVTADLENAAAMKKKANADASNVGKNLKASDGTSAAAAKDIEENLAAWGTALGTGEIEETSNELVTGATVYAETRANVSGTHISADSDVGTNLSALDTEIVKNAGDISGLKDMSNLTQTGVAAVKTLSKEAVIVAAGTNVKVDPTTDKDGNITYTVSTDLSKSKELLQKANTDASNVGKNLKAADGTSAASATDVQKNLAAWGAALGTGSIANDSTQLVTGATVYAETRANVSGTHISADSDVGTNLSSLDKEIVQNASDIATNAANIQKNKDDIAALDTKITENTDKISQVESKVNANTDSIQSVQKQVDTNTGKISDLESKVDTNTNNISKLGDRVTETENQISAIDDRVSAQEKLVSYDADASQIKIGGDKSIKADTVTIAGAAGDRTLTGLKDGEAANDAATVGQMNTAIDKKIAENAYTVESGNTDTLKVEKDEANKTWTVTAQTGEVSADNNGLVTGAKVYEAVEKSKADGGTYTIDSNNRTATVMNKDGSTAFVLTVDESIAAKYKAGDNVSISDDNTISVTTTGKVASGDTGIVTGGAVYEKTGDTSKLTEAGLGDNLTDGVLAVNDRVLTVNDRMNSLSDDIHKVGAGAAALAALRPEAFTPEDKLSFAVGFGHYKNANAGAFGAFYKPNADTTVSVGSTIGNGDPMVNMGVSFKIGARSKGAGIYSSNAELIRELNTLRAGDEKQKQVINAQAKRIIRLEKENAEIKADNEQMKAQIAQIMKKLSMSDTVRKTAVVR